MFWLRNKKNKFSLRTLNLSPVMIKDISADNESIIWDLPMVVCYREISEGGHRET